MKTVDIRTRVRLGSILSAVDFSSASQAGLLYARAIARRYGSKIFLAHVIRPDICQMVSPEAMREVLEDARRYAEKQMADLMISGRLRGVPHQVLLGQGELWTTLSSMIQKHEIDMIVVGTHGRTGLPKILLGSVAEQIFRLAPCPVLTVGPRVSGEVPDEVEIRTLVYATDFSPASERAAAYALSMAQEYQAHLVLLNVVQDCPSGSEAESDSVKRSVTDRLRALAPEEVVAWCDPVFAVEFGSPAERILKVADECHADLIVLGVRRPEGTFGHLPPATAYKVVCRAPCPVLTVRG